MTPGYKSTEWWLSIAAFLVGVFVASGVLPATHWSMKLGGALLAGLASLGYAVSRGIAKSGSGPGSQPAKALLPLVVLVSAVLCAGCTFSWQQTTKLSLDAAGSVTEGATTIGLDAYAAMCRSAALTCGCAPQPAPCPCPQLDKCQADRRTFATLLKSAQAARYAGYATILAADQVKAVGALETLKKLAADIAVALRALEVGAWIQ